MKAVTFNPVAITDLEKIISPISQDNPDAAADVRTAIFETAQSLGPIRVSVCVHVSVPRVSPAFVSFLQATIQSIWSSIVKAPRKSKYSAFFTAQETSRLFSSSLGGV